MTPVNFDNLAWHDAIIKNIVINRSDPGNSDTILFEIAWPDTTNSKIVFEDVYWARLILNFGIVAEETVLNAFVAIDDLELTEFYSKWKGLMNDVKLSCFIIFTASTGSEIKIIAKNFRLLS